MSHTRRMLVKWARTVHLYLTLFALVFVLFFAATGFMLNHEDWFSPAEPVTRTQTGAIPTALLGPPPDKLALVELLRKDYGAVGGLAGFEDEEDRLRVTFTRPGGRVEAVIRKESGEAEVTGESRGAAGVMLDLHRGKASGRAWGLVIDAVCVALLVVGATGLILWWSLRGRGRFGILVIGAGVAIGVSVFVWLVP
jgi:hypothetical protein